MVDEEIFPNPTVKLVAFEIKFPNLFFLESKMGELQTKIMDKFPDSALLFRRQMFFADLAPGAKIEEVTDQMRKEEELTTKVWSFKSPNEYELELTTFNLVIKSSFHKTYSLEGGDKFRDIISFVVNKFLEIASIPIMNRIGLRYIDECPIPSKDNATFSEYYNSTFPLDRFSMDDANEMLFNTLVKRGDYFLRYVEALKKVKDQYKLILDFDGFTEKIESKDYLTITDNIHKMISDEYKNTIKEAVREYMRMPKE